MVATISFYFTFYWTYKRTKLPTHWIQLKKNCNGENKKGRGSSWLLFWSGIVIVFLLKIILEWFLACIFHCWDIGFLHGSFVGLKSYWESMIAWIRGWMGGWWKISFYFIYLFFWSLLDDRVMLWQFFLDFFFFSLPVFLNSSWYRW